MDDRLTRFFGDAFHKRIFLICVCVAIGLIVGSFFVPPLAVIDGSILAAVGEIFGFAALGEVGAAIERGHTASISHGNTTIEIRKEDDKADTLESGPREEYEGEEVS